MTGPRVATPADEPVLVGLARHTFTETFGHLYPPSDLAAFLDDCYAPERIRADLADPRKRTWLAERDGRPVGFALAGPCKLPHPEVTDACGELARVYLLAEAQGLGLGGRLLDAAFAWLLEGGPRDLWIGVYEGNVRARALYAARGFEEVGEYVFWVGQTGDRELILRRRS